MKLRERPRTDSSCANFSLRVIRGLLIECVMLGGGWDDLSCEKGGNDHQRISLPIITSSDVHWQWLLFCKMALVLFFSGGGVILEDDSTQRLRGKPYNKVAIFLHRFILLV